MGPLVVFGTIATHFFGGSAGREGTAVQMGASIADQFTYLFRLQKRDKQLILIAGVSAGFAAVFGTPLAGAIFGLEVFLMGRLRYNAILPSFLTAIIADYTTIQLLHNWGVEHSHYHIPILPKELEVTNILLAALAGVLFGLTSLLFSKTTNTIGSFFKKKISYPPLRPVIGGALVALIIIGPYYLFEITSTYKYAGLGIPTIQDAFSKQLPPYDFIAKLLLTALTLGAGFKGGEVTPLFFIGATLGNALAIVFPDSMPMGLLAGMGFVAVFAGATNTPIACTVMGMELFGLECGVYVAIACIVSYLLSGHSSIYNSQMIGTSKVFVFGRDEGKSMGDVSK